MTPAHSEPCRKHPTCEIRVGPASWDQTKTSVKFMWFDKNKKAARGGEVPIDALPQMMEMAIRTGYLKLNP
jgi:hypothetical protein